MIHHPSPHRGEEGEDDHARRSRWAGPATPRSRAVSGSAGSGWRDGRSAAAGGAGAHWSRCCWSSSCGWGRHARSVPCRVRQPSSAPSRSAPCADHLEERESHDSLDDEVRRDADTEPRDHRAPQHRRHQPRVEHVVADPERVLLLARVALLLDVPGTLEGTTDRTRPELVEVLAVPAAGGVLRCGDADVMAPVVLDVEVAVEALAFGPCGGGGPDHRLGVYVRSWLRTSPLRRRARGTSVRPR